MKIALSFFECPKCPKMGNDSHLIEFCFYQNIFYRPCTTKTMHFATCSLLIKIDSIPISALIAGLHSTQSRRDRGRRNAHVFRPTLL